MDAGVEFVAVDQPFARRLTLHILSAVAEDEARRISERTKAALAAAKARGTKLGSPVARETVDVARAARSAYASPTMWTYLPIWFALAWRGPLPGILATMSARKRKPGRLGSAFTLMVASPRGSIEHEQGRPNRLRHQLHYATPIISRQTRW